MPTRVTLAVRARHLPMPRARAIPSGTATHMVSTARTREFTSAVRNVGSLRTDRNGSVQYQRRLNPCHTDLLRPELKEKSTAIATGTSDQST